MLEPKPQPEKVEIRTEQESVQIPFVAPEKLTSVALITSAVPQPKAPPAPVIRKAKPLYRHNPPPRYPRLARKRKYQGVVILEATTSPKGKVVRIKVLRSIPMLDQAAIDAVKQWVYEPMIIKGKPRAVTFTVTVRFKLKNGEPVVSGITSRAAEKEK